MKTRLKASLDEKGHVVPEGGLRFTAGFLSGACTAFATQWMHNVSLFAGGV